MEVIEVVGDSNTAELRLVGGPNESNRIRIAQRDADDSHYELEIVDEAGVLRPGAGCDGGNASDTPVTCVLHKPHEPEIVCVAKLICNPVAGVAWSTTATIVLGDLGSSLEASATDIDEIVTGGGRDTVDPGAGKDKVSTGSGHDRVNANAIPDGPDVYDLGSGGDTPLYLYEFVAGADVIDYRERVESIELRADDLHNDGSPGEDDKVVGAEVVRAGAGNDLFVGGAGTDVFFGGPGNDRLYGGGSNDALYGEAGDDRLIGAAGSDELIDAGRFSRGDDFVAGGGGSDFIEPGAGRDRVLGGNGDDAISLGEGGDIGVGGPGDDDIRGAAGNDRLVGNGGADKLSGAGGRDAIVAAVVGGGLTVRPATAHGRLDRQRDMVECGSEIDAASTNPWDEALSCERVFSLPPLPRPTRQDHRPSPNN